MHTTDVNIWDELSIELTVLDQAIHEPRVPLPESGGRASPRPGPALYLVWYTGDLPMYRAVADGCWPLYVGSAVSGSERLARHRRNTRPVRNLRGGRDLWVLALPMLSRAAALYLEQLVIDRLQTVWNVKVLAGGFGSRGQGATRRAQVAPPWSRIHPGRVVGSGTPTVTTAFLRKRIEEHLRATARPLWPPLA